MEFIERQCGDAIESSAFLQTRVVQNGTDLGRSDSQGLKILKDKHLQEASYNRKRP